MPSDGVRNAVGAHDMVGVRDAVGACNAVGARDVAKARNAVGARDARQCSGGSYYAFPFYCTIAHELRNITTRYIDLLACVPYVAHLYVTHNNWECTVHLQCPSEY